MVFFEPPLLMLHITIFLSNPPPSPCVKMFPYISLLNTETELSEYSFFWSVGLVIPRSYCAFLSKQWHLTILGWNKALSIEILCYKGVSKKSEKKHENS